MASLTKDPSDTRKRKEQRSILVRKSKILQQFNVYDEGIDRTPKPLDPYIYEGTKERQITSTSVAEEMSVSKSYIETPKRKSEGKLTSDTQLFFSVTKIQSQTWTSFTTFAVEEPPPKEVIEEVFVKEEEVKIPTHISLILKETDTFFILDLPSWTEYRDSDEGKHVQYDNDMYEYMTEGKGRNRRTITVAVQTIPILMKMRDTDCVRIETQSTGSYASNWEMYDTLEEMKQKKEVQIEEDADVLPTNLAEKTSVESYKMSAEERQALKIVKSPNFQNALCIIERLLANNVYNEQQKIFRDIVDEETTYTDDEVKYKYTLEKLWSFTFKPPTNLKMPIVSVEWNPVNKDLVAVGYGKFFNTDWVHSMVNIWNIKNPVNPERSYKLKHPVTHLSFSLLCPNILGIALYNGEIWLINISRRDLNIVARTDKSDETFTDICSQIKFLPPTRTDNEDELIAIYHSGKVLLMTTTSTKVLKYQQIMCTAKADGKLKGLETIRKCAPLKIAASRFVAALVFCQNPVDPNIYYIGTNDGVIHICSRNYLNQHLDMFLAHEGPVFAINFHPFCPKLFVTCGSDMYTRIWCEGISEPLIQYYIGLGATTDFKYSPTHPSIIVAIRKNSISMWDIQRQTFKPQSLLELQTGTYATCVGFTDNGKCIYVGDNIAQLHIFAIKDIPYPPFFPENLLITIFKQILLYKPYALEKIVTGLERTTIRKRMRELKIKAPKPVNEEDDKCKSLNLRQDVFMETNSNSQVQ